MIIGENNIQMIRKDFGKLIKQNLQITKRMADSFAGNHLIKLDNLLKMIIGEDNIQMIGDFGKLIKQNLQITICFCR